MRQPGYRSHTSIKLAYGVLKVMSVLIAVATVIALIAFLGLLGKFVPLAGIAGVPLLVGALIGFATATMFWAVADALLLLAEGDDAHSRIEFTLNALASVGAPSKSSAASLARESLAPSTTADSVLPPDRVPGYRESSRRVMRRLRRAENITDAPGHQADPVCSVAAGELVAVLGEARRFVYVEASAGSGWLPTSALED